MMRTTTLLLLSGALLVAGLSASGCTSDATTTPAPEVADAELLHEAVWKMTDVMVNDIFSPPQAARAYAYTSVAAYEPLAAADDETTSLAGQLNGLGTLPAPPEDGTYVPAVASLHAMLTVGTEMVFTQAKMEHYHEEVLKRLRERGVQGDVFDRSVAYGDSVAQHVLDWAGRDGYSETRSTETFAVTDEPGRWEPTPPAFIGAVEPQWKSLRPFVLKDGDQFKPERPVPFSLQEDSPFFQQVMEVYRVVNNLSEEQREIAAFWDCNPYVMHTQGHTMFATKQMTPGGHWMGIAIIANRKAGADLTRSAEVLAKTSVALSDGFISAWDEKYRSVLVRPETVINEHVDPDWRPVLQTPPFPEYTSAHSVISAAAAVTLTDAYGENFAFDDTTETAYGLPVRSYDSFGEAAQEAAISRLYGGIHYRMAVENGASQGRNVGNWIVDNVSTRSPVVANRE